MALCDKYKVKKGEGSGKWHYRAFLYGGEETTAEGAEDVIFEKEVAEVSSASEGRYEVASSMPGPCTYHFCPLTAGASPDLDFLPHFMG